MFLRLVALGAGSVAAVSWPSFPAGAAPGGPPEGQLAGISMAGGRTVAVGQDPAGQAMAWWSSGAGWAPAAVPPAADATLGDVAAVAGGFMAVGSRRRVPTVWLSSDGSSWAPVATMGGPGHLAAVAASGRSVLAAGAVLDGESDEGVAPLLAVVGRSGGWGRLSTDGIGDLPHGSLTAVARHAGRWVLAGVAANTSGLWSARVGGSWQAHGDGGSEPVAWSSLISLGDEVVALGTAVAGGEVALSRSTDAMAWRLDEVPAMLAQLGVDLRSVAADPRTGSLMAGTLGDVADLGQGLLG